MLLFFGAAFYSSWNAFLFSAIVGGCRVEVKAAERSVMLPCMIARLALLPASGAAGLFYVQTRSVYKFLCPFFLSASTSCSQMKMVLTLFLLRCCILLSVSVDYGCRLVFGCSALGMFCVLKCLLRAQRGSDLLVSILP